MTETEFRAYLEPAIQGYAQEHIRAGNWHPSEALEKAEKQFRQLLPEGLATKNQYVFSIQEPENGAKVGMIWFAVDDKRAEPTAFIYDFSIAEEFRRRGYGTQALQAIEEKVKALGIRKIGLHVFGHNQAARALYEQVGYGITGLNMSKRVG